MAKPMTFRKDDPGGAGTSTKLTLILTEVWSHVDLGDMPQSDRSQPAETADVVALLRQDVARRGEVLAALLPSREEIGALIERVHNRGIYPDYSTACRATAREIGKLIGMPDDWLWRKVDA